jgi:tRNA nucleotidyltransferase/poly(A) polymerase
MTYPLFSEFSVLIEPILENKKEDQKIFLVGGAVRDALLKRTTNDLDFISNKDVRSTAKQISEKLNGAFYMLDDERKTARVIVHLPEKKTINLDFATIQQGGIETDLRSRDFTINAMAFDLDTQQMIDPLGGVKDLHQKRLIACSPTSLSDDPVRILRGIRLSLDIQARITSVTKDAMQNSSHLLPNTSIERQRDELFRILSGKKVSSAFRIMDQFGVLETILPELHQLKGFERQSPNVPDLWEDSLALMRELEMILEIIVGNRTEGSGKNIRHGLMVLQLGQFRHQLEDHYAKVLNPNRTIKALILLASIYRHVGKTQSEQTVIVERLLSPNHNDIGSRMIEQRGKALALSQVEVRRLKTIIQNQSFLTMLVKMENVERPSKREIYKFFKRTGEAGIDICLILLAGILARHGSALVQDEWGSKLVICQDLFDAWWNKKSEVIDPPRLLSGNELKEQFDLLEGPKIGMLLEKIREEQAAGNIKNCSDALAFAKDAS